MTMKLITVGKHLVLYGAICLITFIFCVIIQIASIHQVNVTKNSLGDMKLYNTEKLPETTSRGNVSEELERKEYRLPNAIIIGVSKCGTRALLNYFRIHPDTSHNLTENTGEINFFNLHYKNGLEWYKSKMVPASKEQTVMEKSPSYFFDEVVPERIYKMNSSIKLIIMMCDPVHRVISHYTGLYVNAKNDGKTIESFEQRVHDTYGNIKPIRMVVKGCYLNYLQKWLKFFPLKQIHFVDGESLRTDPYPEVKKVERFLGLRDYIKREHFVYVDWKGFHCLNPPSIFKRVICLGQTKGRTHIEVDPLVRQQLSTFYKLCNRPLSRVINQTYSWMEIPETYKLSKI